MIDNYKENFSDTHRKAVAQMKSQHLWKHVQDLCKISLENNMERERRHKVIPLTEGLLAIDSCWERESRVSLIV